MSSPNQVVTPPARRAARRHTRIEAIARQLHRWMKRNGLRLAQLEAGHVDQFVGRPFRKRLVVQGRYDCRGALLSYLQRLYDQGELGFDPSKLRRGKLRRPALSDHASQFLADIAVTSRPSTCSGYRSSLGRFCHWARDRRVEIERLDRPDLCQYLAQLQQQGLSPTTRCHHILALRTYLRWLDERGLLAQRPELLIRPTDLPTCPQYLPRPISPEADRELRARLAASSCRYQQGLLLMRNTGLRLGELVALEYDCVRSDLHRNCFLKVPLGKLYNERLVPLDFDTAHLIKRLQATGHSDRAWLLESVMGKRTAQRRYRRALREACEGIAINGPMVTHRLRHTYATTLINGGMSLVGVMRLLGHRSYQMTLRYAAITQETIGREYFQALGQIEQRYQEQLQHVASAELDPPKILDDLGRWIAIHIADEAGHPEAARRLLKRIRRLAAEIRAHLCAAQQP